MKLKPKKSIYEYFSELEDPRVDRTKRHKLIDIIIITICAVICDANTWVDIEAYGESKYEWLKSFLELPNGIPSHDTFARVFARLDPEKLQQCFLSWIYSVSQITDGEIIAIDGKTLRGSSDQKKSQKPIHMVSAWATANRLVLGKIKVDNKSNEITAIPKLLKVLSISGCLVTIDAMGCQKKIVKQITEQNADYVITLKKNQGYFYQRVEKLLNKLSKNEREKSPQSDYCISDLTRGRIEGRYYYMMSNIVDEVDPFGEWKNLKSIGFVDYFRSEKNGEITCERRYYISSLDNNAEVLAEAIRSHWRIENQLNWVLDVQFQEDDSRIRKDNAPENFAIIRQIALNLLNQEKTVKTGSKINEKELDGTIITSSKFYLVHNKLENTNKEKYSLEGFYFTVKQ